MAKVHEMKTLLEIKRGTSQIAKARFTKDDMRTIVLVILVLLLLGALPTWPYSASWGYYPSGGLGLVLLIVVILALTGRL
jgi:polyferredoxin